MSYLCAVNSFFLNYKAMDKKETKDQVTVDQKEIDMVEQRAAVLQQRAELAREYREDIKFYKVEVEYLELMARREKAKADRVEALTKMDYYLGLAKQASETSKEPKREEPLKEEGVKEDKPNANE